MLLEKIKNLLKISWIRVMSLTAITFPLGDTIAQLLTHGAVDPFRVFYMSVIGATSGLIFYLYFPYVDRRFKQGRTVLKKILTTEILFVPVYYMVLFGLLAMFQGKLDDFGGYLEETFLLTYLAGQLYWLAVNVLNFNLFTDKQRVWVMAAAYIPWGLYLSLVGHLDIQGKLETYLGDYAYLEFKYVLTLIAVSLVALGVIFKDEFKRIKTEKNNK